MEQVLCWFANHWKTLGISGGITAVGGALMWFPKYHKAKAEAFLLNFSEKTRYIVAGRSGYRVPSTLTAFTLENILPQVGTADQIVQKMWVEMNRKAEYGLMRTIPLENC